MNPSPGSEQSGVECACACVLRVVQNFVVRIMYNITVCAAPIKKCVARINRDLYGCEPPKIWPRYAPVCCSI